MVDGESKKGKDGEKKEVEGREKKGDVKKDQVQDITGVYEYFRNLWGRLREKNFYLDFFKTKDPGITLMLGEIEEKSQDLSNKILKVIEDFLEHELKSLKDHSEEDLKKIKTIVAEYKSAVVKVFEDLSKSMSEMKDKSQKRFLTADELTEFVKFSESRMEELKKTTDGLINSMDKSQFNLFKQNLAAALKENNEGITSACNKLLDSLKDSLVEKPVPPKLPLSEIKMPGMQTKKVIPSSKDEKTVPKPIIPPEIRDKLRKFSFKKHFNSETVTGRANVAKLSIFMGFVGILYWRRRRSQPRE